MKRLRRRSTAATRSMVGRPAMQLRSPRAAYSGIARMPLTPSRSARETASAASPRHDTTPIPVTTTRRMSEALRGLEQTDAQVARGVDRPVVDDGAAVGDDHLE